MSSQQYLADEDYKGEMNDNSPKYITLEEEAPDNIIIGILLWRSPSHTIMVLLALIVMQLAFLWCSIISVVAWTGLGIMLLSLFYQAYRYVKPHHEKTDSFNRIETNRGLMTLFCNSFIPHQYYYLHACEESHCPNETFFHDDIEGDAPSDLRSSEFLQTIHRFLVATRELLLLKRPMQSAKLALILYILTKIGATFNFSTILLMGTLCGFTLPKAYEIYKNQICCGVDKMVSSLREQKEVIVSRMTSKAKVNRSTDVGQQENGSVEVLQYS